MQFIFITIAITGLVYFIFKKRQFDYFSLAFFSSTIYFLPGFFGASAHYADGKWIETPIYSETYAVMTSVMASIWFFAWLSTYLPNLQGLKWSFPAYRWVLELLLMVAFIGLIGMLIFSNGNIFHPDKKLVMEQLGRWHILFYTASMLGFSISYVLKRYLFLFLFLTMLAFDVYIGFRTAFAISSLSVLILFLLEKGKLRLISLNWKFIAAVLLFGLLMFGYKAIYSHIKAGAWDVVLKILSTPDTYLKIFSQSEPFVTQQVLNEVVSQDFKTSMTHIYDSIYQFILFAPDQGVNITTFNGLFQSALFPEVTTGMAANIWAQMWSAGGWVLLILFIIFYNLILMVGNWTLKFRHPIIKAGLIPMFCYWAFYIHRNELGYVLNQEKRLLLLLFLLMITMSLIRNITNRKSKDDQGKLI